MSTQTPPIDSSKTSSIQSRPNLFPNIFFRKQKAQEETESIEISGGGLNLFSISNRVKSMMQSIAFLSSIVGILAFLAGLTGFIILGVNFNTAGVSVGIIAQGIFFITFTVIGIQLYLSSNAFVQASISKDNSELIKKFTTSFQFTINILQLLLLSSISIICFSIFTLIK